MYVKVPRLELPRIINWEMIKIFAKVYTGANPGRVKTAVVLRTNRFRLLSRSYLRRSDYIIILADVECFEATSLYSLAG